MTAPSLPLCEGSHEPAYADYRLSTPRGTASVLVCGICSVLMRQELPSLKAEELPGRFDDRGIIRDMPLPK